MGFPGIFCSLSEGRIEKTSHNYHYLTRVLRLKPGDYVYFLDGSGKRVLKIIKNINSERIEFDTVQVEDSSNFDRPFVTVFTSLLKQKAWEFFLEKITEIGVYGIVPMICEHTVVRNVDFEKKLTRWYNLLKKAMMQSKNPLMPTIFDVINFNELENFELFNRGTNIVLDKNGTRKPDIKKSDFYNVFIGPEGGFSNSELAFFKEKETVFFNISENILRAETAAIVGTSLIKFLIF